MMATRHTVDVALREPAVATTASRMAECSKLANRPKALAPFSLTPPVAEHVKLNVGGVRYETTLTTLRRCPTSMLAAMFSGREGVSVPVDADGYVFIDRNGTHFGTILDYLRTDELLVPADDVGQRALRRELDYYAIDPPCAEEMSGYTREDVKAYLREGKDLLNLDLCGLDLSGLYFAEHWEGASFRDVNLSRAVLCWNREVRRFGDGPVFDKSAFENAAFHGAMVCSFIFDVLTPEQKGQVARVFKRGVVSKDVISYRRSLVNADDESAPDAPPECPALVSNLDSFS